MLALRRRIVFEWLALTLTASALAIWLTLQAPLVLLDHFLFDALSPMLSRALPDDVVIVAIDVQSIRALGRWPWDRRHHAQLLKRLVDYQPSAVVFDVLFSESFPEQDAVFADAMKEAPPVFLPISFEPAGPNLSMTNYPVAMLRSRATGLGHIHIEIAPDSSVRDVYLWQGIGSPSIPHLSLSVCRTLFPACQARYPNPAKDERSIEERAGPWEATGFRMIPFAGPPGHFTQISYVDILSGKTPVEALRGKILFVGAATPSMGDHYVTPTSWHHFPMSGVEVLANVFDMLRQPLTLRPLETTSLLIASMILFSVAMTALLFIGHRANILLFVAYLAGLLGLSVLLLRFCWIWFSPVPLWTTMLVVYPVWNWRRLALLQRELDDRVQQLLNIPTLLGASWNAALNLPASDRTSTIDNRVEKLRMIADRIQDTQTFVRQALEAFPGSVLVTDDAWRIVLMNQRAEMLLEHELPLHDTPLLHFFERLGKAELSDLPEAIDKTVAQHRNLTFQIRDDQASYLVSIAPYRLPLRALDHLVVCVLDITLWQQAKAVREDLMNFLSHDIRSPISSIIMTLDNAALDKGDIETYRDLLSRVRRYAERSLSLADGFLNLAKAESINPEKFVEIELHEVVEIAIDDLWLQAKAHDIRVLFDNRIRGPELVGAWVSGDRDLLIRAVINLLLNALKYSPSGTTVTVRLERVVDDWVIRVIDQGRGIAPEKLALLFGKFERIHRRKEGYRTGIGLGLLIVKSVVDRHQGNVTVSSKPSEGACFSIFLPSIAPPEALDDSDSGD